MYFFVNSMDRMGISWDGTNERSVMKVNLDVNIAFIRDESVCIR